MMKLNTFAGAIAALAIALTSHVALAADDAAKRVISVGGASTEIVYQLGHGKRLVAVDSTSRVPAAARELPDVGYMRRLSAEPILALEPDLIIAAADAGPVTVLDQLREAGVKVVSLPGKPSAAGVLDKIEAVAAALGDADAGKKLKDRVGAEMEAARIQARPRVLFLLSIGAGRPPLVGGSETSADGIINMAGGINAAGEIQGYKPLSPEAMIAIAPDVLLVTNRSHGMMGGKDSLLSRPEIALSPAGKARRVVSMDGGLLLGFGPRTGEAVRVLTEKLRQATAITPAAN